MSNAIMLISCSDQKGITASVSHFIYQHNGNILHADQHIDDQTNTFFMRIEWSLKGFSLEKGGIRDHFRTIADKFKMEWNLTFSDEIPRAAVFVSKQLHCLYDLLLRQRSGQLLCEIPLIISNHPSAREVAHHFNTHFFEFPISKENKIEQEKRELQLLKESRIDFVVLARYGQILSRQFIDHYKNRIINIHHSFLPAFAGKRPYAQAYRKGVKIIGATSHYVTEDLDEGPIIEQDTVRISHRDSLHDLVRKGEDLEKAVLNRAVRWHLERKVLGYSNKTVVFS